MDEIRQTRRLLLLVRAGIDHDSNCQGSNVDFSIFFYMKDWQKLTKNKLLLLTRKKYTKPNTKKHFMLICIQHEMSMCLSQEEHAIYREVFQRGTKTLARQEWTLDRS